VADEPEATGEVEGVDVFGEADETVDTDTLDDTVDAERLCVEGELVEIIELDTIDESVFKDAMDVTFEDEAMDTDELACETELDADTEIFCDIESETLDREEDAAVGW